MIIVRIKSADFETKTGTSKRSGQAYSIREQIGYAVLGDEIRRVRISLNRDQPVYAPGDYQLLPQSFTTDRFDALALGRLVLKPIAKAAAA